MIPLLGFLQGDTLGVLVFAQENDTMADVAKRLIQSCQVRVAFEGNPILLYKNKAMPDTALVSSVGFKLLDRIDVRKHV